MARDVQQSQLAAGGPEAATADLSTAPGKQTLAESNDGAGIVENPDLLAKASLFGGGSTPWARAASSKPHYAKIDEFNHKQDEHRPHVGHDVKLAHDTTRYSIENGTKTRRHDKISAGTAVTINVAHTRELHIHGKMVKCVLTRTVDNGAAWTPVSAVAHSPHARHALEARVDHRAAHDEADEPSKHEMENARPMKFRHGVAPHTDLALTGHVSSQSRSNYDHYLFRERTAQMQQPFHHGFYNISMNLPQHGTPPVQADIALPGDRFFVIEKRQVSLYEKEDPATFAGTDVAEKQRSWWVFGCAAKKHGNHWVPDHTRRGWVPARVLEHS